VVIETEHLLPRFILRRHHSDKTLRELGQLAGGMHYPAVTMAVRRFEAR
jgi:hypothetical protein